MKDIPDMVQAFPGAALFIIVGTLAGIGWALYEKEDAVEAWAEAWGRGGLGALAGLLLWYVLTQLS